MTDQLSRDLASLRIERSVEKRGSMHLGRWGAMLLGVAVLVVGYPRAKAYIEGRLFKREVTTSEVVLVSPVQSQVDLTATGYVTPQVTAKVGSKAAGRIASVHVREGDTVAVGQVLFELDPADERTALSSARARVTAATARVEASRAELSEAEVQLKREQRLVDLGATAPATVDDRKLRIEVLRKQIEAAEAEVRVTRAEANVTGQQLRNLRIVAPIAGTAVTKPAQLGDVVAPTTTLVELVDFQSLLVEVDVPEARVAQVKPDGPCQLVLDAAPAESLKCKVLDFAPRVNRAKATATVKVRLVETAKRLWPDMSARVSFLASEIDDELRKQPSKKYVAAAALTRQGDQPGVWTVVDQRLRFEPVVAGAANDSSVELISGPAPGTRVVLEPASDLRDGQTVKDKQASN